MTDSLACTTALRLRRQSELRNRTRFCSLIGCRSGPGATRPAPALIGTRGVRGRDRRGTACGRPPAGTPWSIRRGGTADVDGVEDRADQAQRLERADDLARIAERIRKLSELVAGRIRPAIADALPEGTEVTVRFSDASIEMMRVVMVPDDAVDTLTRDSPLGRPVSRARPGDTIIYTGPDGAVVAELLTIRLPAR